MTIYSNNDKMQQRVGCQAESKPASDGLRVIGRESKSDNLSLSMDSGEPASAITICEIIVRISLSLSCILHGVFQSSLCPLHKPDSDPTPIDL